MRVTTLDGNAIDLNFTAYKLLVLAYAKLYSTAPVALKRETDKAGVRWQVRIIAKDKIILQGEANVYKVAKATQFINACEERIGRNTVIRRNLEPGLAQATAAGAIQPMDDFKSRIEHLDSEIEADRLVMDQLKAELASTESGIIARFEFPYCELEFEALQECAKCGQPEAAADPVTTEVKSKRGK